MVDGKTFFEILKRDSKQKMLSLYENENFDRWFGFLDFIENTYEDCYPREGWSFSKMEHYLESFIEERIKRKWRLYSKVVSHNQKNPENPLLPGGYDEYMESDTQHIQAAVEAVEKHRAKRVWK